MTSSACGRSGKTRSAVRRPPLNEPSDRLGTRRCWEKPAATEKRYSRRQRPIHRSGRLARSSTTEAWQCTGLPATSSTPAFCRLEPSFSCRLDATFGLKLTGLCCNGHNSSTRPQDYRFHRYYKVIISRRLNLNRAYLPRAPSWQLPAPFASVHRPWDRKGSSRQGSRQWQPTQLSE